MNTASRQVDRVEDFSARAAWIGERTRRLALVLLAALATSRAYWPSETDASKGSGSGLAWTAALLVVLGLAIGSSLIGGKFRVRWSWTDAAFLALVFLVGLSASRALDRRPAINVAWEWGGLAFAYVLARNLPRTRGESTALAGVLVATAVAVSVYGLYQAKVEIPQLQEQFRRDPQRMLREANVANEPRQVQAFANRLVGSNEPFATFGLANSLAGYLVGPLVLLLAMIVQNMADRRAPGSRWDAIARAAIPLLCLLGVLILTKSRSAMIGLLAATAVLAWHARGRVPRRLLLGVCGGGVALMAALVAVGMATGRLDREVLTQSTLSMRYRWEYWQGAWAVITDGTAAFWSGVGPGNFGHHYLLHKLPWSSEEVQDPHNLFLEVWATAGFWAFAALIAALGLAFWNLLGPLRHGREEALARTDKTNHRKPRDVSRETIPPRFDNDVDTPPASVGWLAWSGALGLVMVLTVGQFNLFQNDLLVRWLVLLAGWLLAAFVGLSFWRRVPVPAFAFGAAVLAVVINLLAAGGIGFQSVALGLWLLVALGLNLREDRPCGRLREYETRIPGFALALVWAALAGTFAGAIFPHWRSESALARADDALSHQPPQFERAQAAYDTARVADRLSPRPWLGDAYLQLLIWQSRGSRPDDQRWRTIPALLLKAASSPRNPDAWTLHSERAKITRDLLAIVAPSLSPREIIVLQGSIVEATRTASRLYPANPDLHARLAEASAAIQMFQDSASEAKEALRLDELLTPHPDKRLSDTRRDELKARLPDWEQKAAQFPIGEQPAAAAGPR